MAKRRPGAKFLRNLTSEEVKVMESGPHKLTLVDGEIRLVPSDGFVLIGKGYKASLADNLELEAKRLRQLLDR